MLMLVSKGHRKSAGAPGPHLHLEDAAEVVVGHAEALRLRRRGHDRERGDVAAGGGGRGGPRELQLDAQRVALDGLVRAASLAQRVAQIVVGLGEVGLVRQRLPVRLDRLF
jgi:hypothetical protein